MYGNHYGQNGYYYDPYSGTPAPYAYGPYPNPDYSSQPPYNPGAIVLTNPYNNAAPRQEQPPRPNRGRGGYNGRFPSRQPPPPQSQYLNPAQHEGSGGRGSGRGAFQLGIRGGDGDDEAGPSSAASVSGPRGRDAGDSDGEGEQDKKKKTPRPGVYRKRRKGGGDTEYGVMGSDGACKKVRGSVVRFYW